MSEEKRIGGRTEAEIRRIGSGANNFTRAYLGSVILGLCRAAFAPSGWQPIETAPRDETLILAATADGRRMIWSGALLAVAMSQPTPAHLTFPAVCWMPLPPAPEPAKPLCEWRVGPCSCGHDHTPEPAK